MRRRADWVKVVMAGIDPKEPRPHCHCERCDERLVTELPMRLETYVEVTKGFVKAHRNCKEKHRTRTET